ncbi:MAG: roadblock/LC7 domain-containing protein [Promethearchaeati archaeon SRVP18_Atabeyarchaeia-1]
MAETLSKQMKLTQVLQDTVDSGSLDATCIVSEDGLPICSAICLPEKESILSAMAAAILAMGERTVEELKQGKLSQVTIQADDGITVVRSAGKHQLIIGTARSKVGLGLIHLVLQKASIKITEVLDGDDFH